MVTEISSYFDEKEVLHKLKHYLPSQYALKDFVHHNTLHAFQDKAFFKALQMGEEIFGMKTTLRLDEYKKMYWNGKIPDHIIDKVIRKEDSTCTIPEDQRKVLMLSEPIEEEYKRERVGQMREQWKKNIKLDVETIINHTLFKILGSYLDQGISAIEFRSASTGFLDAIRSINSNTMFPIFNSKRVQGLLANKDITIKDLLEILIGDERYYEQYLFDQQFSHPGWSGFVAVVEERDSMLFDKRKISLRGAIIFELLLEIDTLDDKIGIEKRQPLATFSKVKPTDIFKDPEMTEQWWVRKWWQESLEWSYYDQVLLGLQENIQSGEVDNRAPKFQAYFCIDDREESIRRWVEKLEPEGETLGSPAHFNQLIKYRPKGGKFNAHVCPAPASPKHIIVDDADSEKVGRDLRFHDHSHGIFSGWIISQTIGIWSAVKLFIHLFKPSATPSHSSAFEHMSHTSNPQLDYNGETLDGLQVGYTVEEMGAIVYDELFRTGRTINFAPLVYFIGHGGSSTNNPYYAGYNCGACSGKPSSLNSRLICKMANRLDVRQLVKAKGIEIPDGTQFVGGLHDTTRDAITFYDVDLLTIENQKLHQSIADSFQIALDYNAKERGRQFLTLDTKRKASEVHKDVNFRAYSLFEPRPELNHSNNCICIVGNRALSKNLFLDQRAFLNSYDYSIDVDGKALTTILGAGTPVCGGINLEYYFSRVDNERLGAGSKLPHNVVGLFGVANGVEGDLRTGLPSQMIDVHEPLRLMMIVQQKREIVQKVLDENPGIKDWYVNGWLHLAVVCPMDKKVYYYNKGEFTEYKPISDRLSIVSDQEAIAETYFNNTPVFKIA